ncbi:LamG-like jellyroll fold domain-containing protein [Aerosakkonema funiforme]|uniref:LamG-like jellyroll fold domain-containing protein n=1 Tax=Aerosakkonema funiforme TaxID=1246630 RepID=UPI0035B91BC6
MANHKILIIDDSGVVRRNTKAMLPVGKFEILEAKDGLEAINLIHQERPNLILLDWILPRVSGWEVYQHIQADPELQKIPLVVMSGRIDEVRVKIPEPFAYFEFLQKIFDQNQLISAIKSAIAKARLRNQPTPQLTNNNIPQPQEYDVVLGGQTPPPVNAVVLGGIAGVKSRLASAIVSHRIAALKEALNYGEAGINLVMPSLKDANGQVRATAYLLLQKRTEIKVRQALREYIPPDMVAWWRLDETDGNTVSDRIGTNHGIINGCTPTPITNTIKPSLLSSLCFDGVNDYVQISDAPALNFGTGDLSICFWVNTSNPHGNIDVIIDKRVESSGAVQGYTVCNYRGSLCCQLADGIGTGWTNYLAYISITNSKWHHVAITVDRDQTDGGRWYLDGVEVGNRFNPTDRQGSLNNAKPLRIGRRSDHPSWPGFFKGNIADVRLFNRVLEAIEIQAIYEA